MAYSANIEASGGVDSFAWTIPGKAGLPNGLSLNSAVCFAWPCRVPATISGTPTTPGAYNFTIHLSSGSTVAEKNFTLTVNSAPSNTVVQTWAYPSISSLSTYSGPRGTTVVINGSGFSATGNQLKFGDLGIENNPAYNLNSSDGRTITFTVPDSNYYACQSDRTACYLPNYMTAPGVYAVSITNYLGISNSVNFTVTN